MKPIAIFQHAASEGPGYLADFLNARQLPWRLVRIDEGEAVPEEASLFSGLVFMGGPMSVNDELLWIPSALSLIRQAVENRIPVLGHCLGGQLMSKALGGQVTRNPVKEIGWGQVHAVNPVAHNWFGETKTFDVFQWHGETFSVPSGATLLLSSDYCVNQAFVFDGIHIGLQCHVEMTDGMIRTWCDVGADEVAENLHSPAVQPSGEMLAAMGAKLPDLQQRAEILYANWLKRVSGSL
ncbi:MAG: type 1 glutamine amidotransferase [Pseudomonadota bacterium]